MKLKWFELVRKMLATVMDDIFFGVGIGFIFYGVFLIFPPAGYIVLGLMMIGIGFLAARKLAKR